MDKELREIVRALREQGFDVRITRKQHLVVTKDASFIAAFSGTPSDWRSRKNSVGACRRHGFIWP